jgi:folate-dependent phosphoribosylglycinamide formyltransferase PurN
MLEIGWFSTGRGPGSRGLLSFVQERVARKEIDGRIQFVFSNREQGEAEGSDTFFDLVRGYGIPLVTFSSRRFRRSVGRDFAEHREEYDREAMAHLSQFDPDICVLAGYMLYVGSAMCQRYSMINLHPALPDGPIGTWQQVIWELIDTRAQRTGAMIHLATEDWDRGPVITYFSLPITGPLFDPLWEQVEGKSVEELKETQGEELTLFKTIRAEGYRREPYLISETLKALADGEISISDRQVLDAQGKQVQGYDLTKHIEESLKADKG